MIITKKAIPRRTVLRGFGASLALPLLDAMVPAFAPRTNAATMPVIRFGVVYVPNGIMMQHWMPDREGEGFELKSILKPFEPFRDRLLVLSGLKGVESDGPHARASTRFLTGVPSKRADGADLQAAVSMDQLIAREQGAHTQLASLELAVDGRDFAGSCDDGFSCAYTNTIAWSGPSTPLPMENSPRVVFERLFGDSGSTDGAVRRARLKRDASLLDSVAGRVADLQRAVGPNDRSKISQYLDAVRDIERRIQTAERQSARELPVIEQPRGVPATFGEHVRLMFDLQLLAYQTDLTRVVTFMFGREITGRTYPEIGVPDAHHPISHHQSDPERLEKLAKINIYHATLVRRVHREAARHSRRGCDAVGSHRDDLWRRYGGLECPCLEESADHRRWRRPRRQGRPPHQVRRRHTACESASSRDGHDGDAHRSARKQHGAAGNRAAHGDLRSAVQGRGREGAEDAERRVRRESNAPEGQRSAYGRSLDGRVS